MHNMPIIICQNCGLEFDNNEESLCPHCHFSLKERENDRQSIEDVDL